MTEEADVFGPVAKIVVFPEKMLCRLVVDFACHDEQMNPPAAFVHAQQEVLHKALENVNRPRNTDVTGALRSVNAEAGTHASRQQHGCDLSVFKRADTGLPEHVLLRLDFRQRHGRQRFHKGSGLRGVLVLKMIQIGEIHVTDLGQEFQALPVTELVIEAQQPVLAQGIQLHFHIPV